MKSRTMLSIIGLITLFIVSGLAQATPNIDTVKINGDTALPGTSLEVLRGDTLDISVRVVASQPEKNVVVEAYIDGYEYATYESVSDSSGTFDMDTNDAKVVKLQIKIPLKAEKDHYDLKVRAGTRTGADSFTTYSLNLKGQKHEVLIKDILMTDEIEAGRGLYTNVRLQNIGQKDEKDMTVKVTIPELNLEQFTTVQELDHDDSTTTEDVVLFVDECAKAGTYDVTAEVDFDEYDKVTLTKQITVKASDSCQKESAGAGKTVIAVPGVQEVQAGKSAVFPIMITNTGSASKTYVITVSKGVEALGTARIDPSNVLIIQPNQPQTVFVYVQTDSTLSQGQKDFTATIASGDEKQDVSLSANVVAGAAASNTNLKQALEIALVALIVVLVIVGLVIGFNKLKPKDDDEEAGGELGQTYY